MPRAKDPIADLKAHRERAASLKAKEKKLRSEAAQFLGELVLKAGLGEWETTDLKTFLDHAAANGAELSIKTAASARNGSLNEVLEKGGVTPANPVKDADAQTSVAG